VAIISRLAGYVTPTEFHFFISDFYQDVAPMELAHNSFKLNFQVGYLIESRRDEILVENELAKKLKPRRGDIATLRSAGYVILRKNSQ